MKRLSGTLAIALGCIILTAGMSVAYSQGFPNKPVRLVVPFAAGNVTDLAGRIISGKFSENMGQQMFVDNRPGANAIIGTEVVSKAAPDGYTLLLGTAGSHGLNSSLYKKLPYDPIEDFAPITQAVSVYYFLIVGNHVPANSVRELVALAKAKPGKLTMAYAASVPQVTGELFKLTTGIDMTLVPYKADSQAFIDIKGGRVDVMFVPTAAVLPHIRAGNVKALAVPTANRSPLLPELPTIAESGYAGFVAGPWLAFLAPAGTPKEIIAKLHTEIVRVLQTLEVKEKLQQLGLGVIGNTPEQLGEVVKTEIAKWATVFKEAKLPATN